MILHPPSIFACIVRSYWFEYYNTKIVKAPVGL